MSEFKGTKGKWDIVKKDPIATKLETTIKCGKIRIAEVKYYNQGENDWTVNDPTIKEGKANALLISKAPEMLDMLKRLRNDYGNYTQNILQESHRMNRINEIEQLIKEATEL